VRRFAEDTAVPISRSRGEIDQLLREWGATGLQWTDEYDRDLVSLRFVWPHEGNRYMARFSIKLPSRNDFEGQAIDKRSQTVSEAKLERLMRGRGRQEHRVLLLWLKAALNAVDAGIVKAQEVFLPFLEGKDGRTVAEVAVPQLTKLLAGSASRMLTAHGEEE